MNLLKAVISLAIILPEKKQLFCINAKHLIQMYRQQFCIVVATLLFMFVLFPVPKALANDAIYLPIIASANSAGVSNEDVSNESNRVDLDAEPTLHVNEIPAAHLNIKPATHLNPNESEKDLSGANKTAPAAPLGQVDLSAKEVSLDLATNSYNSTTNGSVYYVSKFGSNGDGTSWSNAWNELDQINWSVIHPGTTILIDGGQNEMSYYTTMNVTKSGTQNNPIVIQLADESGRNGKAIFNGGRGVELPYCGQGSYTDNSQNARRNGIAINNQSWVTIDGTKWRGITIFRYVRSGLFIDRDSSHITVRNMEIYDNGEAKRKSNGWVPSRPGVRIGGREHTLDRMIIHDNGEDAIQSLWGKNKLGNITIMRSWLYNMRRHPSVNESSNYCTHTDGFQIYDGGAISGITIEESIIGPGFTNGIILGQTPISGNTWADVQNVTIRNVVFSKPVENGVFGYTKTNSQNWILDNVTLDCSNTKYNCIKIDNARHTVRDSIVYGSRIDFKDGLDNSYNNCQWNTSGFSIGQTANPQFRSLSTNDPFSLDDYTMSSNSPCRGKGATVTSVQNLLDNAENPARPRITTSPSLTCSSEKGTLIEAEDGQVWGHFKRIDGHVEHTADVDQPWLGGSAIYSFEARADGIYHIRALVTAANRSQNSYFVHIDEQPTNDYMIWDIQPTNGFEERMVSWRGSGTVENNEYTPMIFHLSKGHHTLVLRGREAKTKLDKICIEQQ